MPKFTYMGPYDEFRPDGLNGPVLHRGDTYTMSRDKKDQLGPRYQWADQEGEIIDQPNPLAGTAAQPVEDQLAQPKDK